MTTTAPTPGSAPVRAEDRLVSAATVRAQLASNPDHLVVDVRTPNEYASGHIAGSINLPLGQVDAHLNRIVNDAGGRLILVCQSGGRACQAFETLADAGMEDLEILEGGMNAWMAAGAPTDVSADAADAWTMERQVRLVAGSVVLGSILTSIRWPAARFVAGGIGTGLTYSALSNTCAMGAVLMKLPFNRPSTADVDAALDRLTSQG